MPETGNALTERTEYRTEPFTVEEVATIPEYKQIQFFRATIRFVNRTINRAGGRELLDEMAIHRRERIAKETANAESNEKLGTVR